MNHGSAKADSYEQYQINSLKYARIKTHVDDNCVEGYNIHSMLIIAINDITRQCRIANLQSSAICTLASVHTMLVLILLPLTQEKRNLPSDPMPLPIDTQSPNQQSQTGQNCSGIA
jgi:hypothetical protein